MNILLLGSGGREHAMAWKLAQSEQCKKLYCAPGNVGTAMCATNVDIPITDFDAIKSFCITNLIDMVVVGPEEPLVNGIYDNFSTDDTVKHIAIIGPSQKGAMLEGSKIFAKEFMFRHNIPTAAYKTFDLETLDLGIEYVKGLNPPIVIKADGLASGKGVIICQSVDEACTVLRDFIQNNELGHASQKVVIEQFLKGVEFSVFILTDGSTYKLLPVAKDYKRIGEGDTGPNTGGMGAVSPVPFVNDELMQKVIDKVIKPTINGLQKEGITYKGFIYVGLMSVHNEPYVIEYNCRMGDPETEVVLPRLVNDLVDLFKHVHHGTLEQTGVAISPLAAVTIVAASKGYPGVYEKNKIISGAMQVTEATVFYAGVTNTHGQLTTNGGRVFTVTALGQSIAQARLICLENMEKIDFEGKFYRKDIGLDIIV